MNHSVTAAGGSKERPRVLVAIRWPVGGIRTWCRDVYCDDSFARFDISLLLPNDPEAHILKRDLAGTRIEVNIVPGVKTTSSFARAVWRVLFAANFDLVHSHGFTSALVVSFARPLKRFRHLVTAHDVVLDDQYRDFRGRMIRRAIAWSIRTADCVQAVSESAADNLRSAFPFARSGRSNYVVVRNGIDSARFLYATARDVRAELLVPADAILVGFFGRFMGQKGFRYLVDAVRKHEVSRSNGTPPMVVLAVGGGGFRREEEEKISQLGLRHCFRFLDFEPDIAGLIKSVDVVAMPSRWEACGLLQMEALTAGTPVVVSDCAGCLEVAQETPALVVPREDSSSLLEGILELSSPERVARARGFQHIAASRFDVSGTRASIARLYGAVLESRRMGLS